MATGRRPGARVSSEPVASPSVSPPSTPSFPPIPLSALVDAVPDAEPRGDTALVDPRRRLRLPRGRAPGALFCCVPGETADGHDFAGAALDAGAAALVVERWLDAARCRRCSCRSVREAMGPIAARAFGDPASALTMLGVTGHERQDHHDVPARGDRPPSGRAPGRDRHDRRTHRRASRSPLDRTTPEAPDLHRLLARMRDEGVGLVAMEVSSHALEQHRIDGVVFDAVAFTNLSQDHLDYHESMERYFEAKAACSRRGALAGAP